MLFRLLALPFGLFFKDVLKILASRHRLFCSSLGTPTGQRRCQDRLLGRIKSSGTGLYIGAPAAIILSRLRTGATELSRERSGVLYFGISDRFSRCSR